MNSFFEIDFLEAGKSGSGDAIALRYANEQGESTIHVVDGGYTDDGDELVSHIRKYYDNPTFLDHVVLTHPDGDHAAGLKKVLEEFEVGTLWMNRPWLHVHVLIPLFDYEYTETGLIQRLKKDFPYTAALEEVAEKHGIEIKDAFQGTQIGKFTVLAPGYSRYIQLIVDSEKTPEAERKAASEGSVFERIFKSVKNLIAEWGQENLKGDTEGTSAENEVSIVQYANLCDKKILLTADAGVEALEEAYEFARDLGVSLPGIYRFQVPHHGSRRNLSSEILEKWLGEKLSSESESPHFTAIVSANRNDKDHPRKAVVRALIHRGAKVIETNGAIRTGKNAPARDGWSAVDPLTYPTEMEE